MTSVTIRYGNYPLHAGEIATGQQRFGISAVALLPDAGDRRRQDLGALRRPRRLPDRFNAPGSDVVYTLTVTNSGGSPVDLSSLVADRRAAARR